MRTVLCVWFISPPFTLVQSCLVQGGLRMDSRMDVSLFMLEWTTLMTNVHLTCPAQLVQLQAWFVSSASEHEDSVRHLYLWMVFLGPGIMGVHVLSPAASQNNFPWCFPFVHRLHVLQSPFLFCFLSLGIKNLVEEFLLAWLKFDIRKLCEYQNIIRNCNLKFKSCIQRGLHKLKNFFYSVDSSSDHLIDII